MMSQLGAVQEANLEEIRAEYRTKLKESNEKNEAEIGRLRRMLGDMARKSGIKYDPQAGIGTAAATKDEPPGGSPAAPGKIIPLPARPVGSPAPDRGLCSSAAGRAAGVLAGRLVPRPSACRPRQQPPRAVDIRPG